MGIRITVLFLFLTYIIGCSNVPFVTVEIEGEDQTPYKSSTFDKLYAIDLHVFVTTSGSRALHENSLAANEKALEKSVMGYSKGSVNTLLLQIGAWIRSSKVYFVNSDTGDFGTMYGKPGSSKIVFKENEVIEFVSTSGQTFTSPKGTYRMVVWRQGGASYAVVGRNGILIQSDHGRNIVAHELGHNFGLRHSDTSSGCNQGGGGTRTRVMDSVSYSTNDVFDDCEKIIARKTLEGFVGSRNSIEIASPLKKNAEKALSHYKSDGYTEANFTFDSDSKDILSAAGIVSSSLAAAKEYRDPVFICGHE